MLWSIGVTAGGCSKTSGFGPCFTRGETGAAFGSAGVVIGGIVERFCRIIGRMWFMLRDKPLIPTLPPGTSRSCDPTASVVRQPDRSPMIASECFLSQRFCAQPERLLDEEEHENLSTFELLSNVVAILQPISERKFALGELSPPPAYRPRGAGRLGDLGGHGGLLAAHQTIINKSPHFRNLPGFRIGGSMNAYGPTGPAPR